MTRRRPAAPTLTTWTRSYLHATSNEQITADQTAALPRQLAARLRGLVGKYEGRASLEADCARDAEELEMLLQALSYRQRGHGHMQPLIDTAIAAPPLRRRAPRRGVQLVECRHGRSSLLGASSAGSIAGIRPLRYVRSSCGANHWPTVVSSGSTIWVRNSAITASCQSVDHP